jgi:hypothetical protein
MSNDRSERQSRQVVYQEICKGHGAIADFRAKLLALLPAASGASAFIVLEKTKGPGPPPPFLAPLGLFGFAAIFGLFMYELRGIEDCVTLRKRAEDIEVRLGISRRESHFRRPPGKLWGLADEIGAGWIVYAAVLTSWLYVAGRGFDLNRRLGWHGWPWLLALLYLGVLWLALLPPWYIAARLAGVHPPRRWREGDPVFLHRGFESKPGLVKCVWESGERDFAKVELAGDETTNVSTSQLQFRYGVTARRHPFRA